MKNERSNNIFLSGGKNGFEKTKNILWYGECLQMMKQIPDQSVNLICCDLPYGVTKNKWDSLIDLDLLWKQYERVIVENGAIVLFGQDKFSARLMLSNEKLHRYNLVWQKTTPTGHLNAKKMPLRSHEDILVFYKKLPTYNAQKTTGHERKVSTAKHKRNSKKTTNYGEHGLTTYDSTERYPKSVLTFATDKQKSALHPTQKPLELIKYLVLTYSNENDWVLDNTCGSNTTGLACFELNRNYIGIENDFDMYEISKERVGGKNIITDYMHEPSLKTGT